MTILPVDRLGKRLPSRLAREFFPSLSAPLGRRRCAALNVYRCARERAPVHPKVQCANLETIEIDDGGKFAMSADDGCLDP
jgi:hypothetical protein